MSEEIDNIYKFAGTIPEKIEADRRRDLLDVITSWGGDFSTMTKKDDYKLLRQCREEIIDNEEEEVESRVQIGIFKEIDCIWKTVNQSLELTTFEPKTGQILRNKIYWEEFGSDIESVALASPVPNVFVEEVNYILVVATAVEIRILAVIFNPFETIHIEPTEYYISTENVTITKIQSTKKGRIFLAGDDGNLFELSYHNEESFWSSRTKCRKLNLTQSVFSTFVPSFFKLSSSDSLIDICVDNDRNLLYTLSFNSKIQLYDLGNDGKSLNVVSSISNLKKSVEKLFPNANSSDLNVASLATITKEDSHAVHLIATTETGFRLYFTTFSDPKAQSNKSYREIGAHSLKLLHVRAPSRKLNNVYASYYFPGNICVLTDTYGLHFHWIFDSPLRKNQEQKEFFPIKEIWNFAFVEGDQSRYKEVATQQRTEQTKFCFVTGSRFYLVEKIRPIDEIESQNSFNEICLNYPSEELYSFLFIVGKSKNIQKRTFEPRDQIMGAELYVARKLTPYWNIPIFLENEGNWTVNPIFQSANTFKDENYQMIQSQLNKKSASEIQTKFLLLDCCQEILIFAEILIPNIGMVVDNADFSISTISSISFARFFSDKKYLIFFKELASVIISKLNEKEGEGFLHRLENLPNLFTQFDKKYYSILEVLLQSSKRNQSEVKFALQNIISMMTSSDQCARIRSSLQKICVELFVLEYFDGIIDLILALCHTIDPHKHSHKYFDNETNDHLVKDIFHQLEEFYQLLIAVLSKLFEQNSKYFAQVLHKMLNVDELPLSYLVFHWLIKTNLMEQLFANDNSIKIPHLENFLICYHPELLENFYNANNQFEKTAQFFFDKYQEETNQQPLTERIKYLEQSLKYAILANSNLEIIIQQYLRVASIQLEIYDILEKNKEKINFDTSNLLNDNFSISDLYHNYAVQLQLSAIQLKIIRVNDVADETTRATVKDIWHFILKHYNKIPLNGLQLFDADYVLDAINQLYPSPTTLPLDEICFYRFKKHEIEKEFIEKVLIRSNVPYEEIFRIYHQKTLRTENPRMIYFLMNSQKDLKIEKLVPFKSNIRQYKELCKDDKDLFQKFTQLDLNIQSVFA